MRKYLPHVLIISFVFIAIPITSATGGSKTLRSYYKSLSASQVQSMPNVVITASNNYDTFEGYSTINHDYDIKTIRYVVIGGTREVYVEVVVDNATGLMWMREGSDNYLEWDEVQKWVTRLNQLGYAGYQDWRLPTLEEAASLLEPNKRDGLYIDPVFNRRQLDCWTGDRMGNLTAWAVGFDNGSISFVPSLIGVSCHGRPVRSVR